jgi:hypothetical protein
MTEDGQAYVVDYVVKHLDGTESKRWGFVSKEAVNIVMPLLPRWP